jgi:hypothetical protein
MINREVEMEFVVELFAIFLATLTGVAGGFWLGESIIRRRRQRDIDKRVQLLFDNYSMEHSEGVTGRDSRMQ